MVSAYRLRRAVLRFLPYAQALCIVLYILYTEEIAYALFMLAATALHETGHLFAFYACREPLPAFGGRGFGFLLTPTGGMLSRRKKFLICMAGPLFNLLACLSLVPALRTGVAQEANFCFFAMNLYTALFNLLPLSGFDGGQMLACLFQGEWGSRFCRALSFLLAVLFYFFAIFLSFLAGGGLYPFALALFLLWGEGKHFADF